jgi:hypothetical protein
MDLRSVLSDVRSLTVAVPHIAHGTAMRQHADSETLYQVGQAVSPAICRYPGTSGHLCFGYLRDSSRLTCG